MPCIESHVDGDEMRIQNWRFDAWGGAFGANVPYRRDNRVPVEVGRFHQGMIEITSGLSADNQVVAAGVDYIREGMLVRPVVKERGL